MVARDDLRLGFDIKAAQLLAQARGGLVELAKIGSERAQLLFQSRAVDGDLTGIVHQPIEQVGADADLFLRRANAGELVLSCQFVHRSRQGFERRRFDCGKALRRRIRSTRCFAGDDRTERLAFR